MAKASRQSRLKIQSNQPQSDPRQHWFRSIQKGTMLLAMAMNARNFPKAFAVGVALMLTLLSADAKTGDELNQQCRSNRDAILGYVAGALDKAAVDSEVLIRLYLDTYDVHKAPEQIERDNGTIVKSHMAIDYCVPKETTIEQLADVFCRYLAENPRQRNNNAPEILGTAIKAACPCE
jgi:hypothetical protein